MEAGRSRGEAPPLQVWAWTEQEDAVLLEHVRQHGTRKWKELVESGRLHGRSTKACCNRFRRLREAHLERAAASRTGQDHLSTWAHPSAGPYLTPHLEALLSQLSPESAHSPDSSLWDLDEQLCLRKLQASQWSKAGLQSSPAGTAPTQSVVAGCPPTSTPSSFWNRSLSGTPALSGPQRACRSYPLSVADRTLARNLLYPGEEGLGCSGASLWRQPPAQALQQEAVGGGGGCLRHEVREGGQKILQQEEWQRQETLAVMEHMPRQESLAAAFEEVAKAATMQQVCQGSGLERETAVAPPAVSGGAFWSWHNQQQKGAQKSNLGSRSWSGPQVTTPEAPEALGSRVFLDGDISLQSPLAPLSERSTLWAQLVDLEKEQEQHQHLQQQQHQYLQQQQQQQQHQHQHQHLQQQQHQHQQQQQHQQRQQQVVEATITDSASLCTRPKLKRPSPILLGDVAHLSNNLSFDREHQTGGMDGTAMDSWTNSAANLQEVPCMRQQHTILDLPDSRMAMAVDAINQLPGPDGTLTGRHMRQMMARLDPALSLQLLASRAFSESWGAAQSSLSGPSVNLTATKQLRPYASAPTSAEHELVAEETYSLTGAHIGRMQEQFSPVPAACDGPFELIDSSDLHASMHGLIASSHQSSALQSLLQEHFGPPCGPRDAEAPYSPVLAELKARMDELDSRMSLGDPPQAFAHQRRSNSPHPQQNLCQKRKLASLDLASSDGTPLENEAKLRISPSRELQICQNGKPPPVPSDFAWPFSSAGTDKPLLLPGNNTPKGAVAGAEGASKGALNLDADAPAHECFPSSTAHHKQDSRNWKVTSYSELIKLQNAGL